MRDVGNENILGGENLSAEALIYAFGAVFFFMTVLPFALLSEYIRPLEQRF